MQYRLIFVGLSGNLSDRSRKCSKGRLENAKPRKLGILLAPKSRAAKLAAMKLKSILFSLLATVGLHANPLGLGEPLPEVSGKNQAGEKVKLIPAKDHEWLLVFFYPKALTGG